MVLKGGGSVTQQADEEGGGRETARTGLLKTIPKL